MWNNPPLFHMPFLIFRLFSVFENPLSHFGDCTAQKEHTISKYFVQNG